MNAKRDISVLMSGGLDSAILISHYLKQGLRVWPLYVAGGLRWETVELYWSRRYLSALKSQRLKPLSILRLDQRDLYSSSHWALRGPVPGSHTRSEAVYLEGRNLLLLCKAGVWSAQRGISRIALALLSANPFRDSRPDFFRAMERIFKTLGHTLRIQAPFIKRLKQNLIHLYRDLPLHLTFSCLKPYGLKHCGQCNKCFERRQSFTHARVQDLTLYAGNAARR